MDISSYLLGKKAGGGTGGKYAPRKICFQYYDGTELDYELANLDTSNITSMESMFFNCYQLTELNLNSFDISNLTNISTLCASSGNLEKFTMTNKTTNKLKNLSQMFTGCTKLNDVNLKINIELEGSQSSTNSIRLGSMFRDCTSLTELDLSGLVIPSCINDVSLMFSGCTSLRKIDIRNLTINGQILIYNNMFGTTSSNSVPDDCEIIVKDDTAKTWITSRFSRLTNVKTVAEYEAE